MTRKANHERLYRCPKLILVLSLVRAWNLPLIRHSPAGDRLHDNKQRQQFGSLSLRSTEPRSYDSFNGDFFDDIGMEMNDMLEDPEARFNEEDLSDLYEISMPRSPSNESEELPVPLSLPDLSLITSDLAYFYLRDELGLSEDTMWKITNEAGSILGLRASTLREKIEVVRSSMSLSDEDIRKLIASFPTFLHLSAKQNLSPTILFLLRQLELGREELRTLVLGCPAILGYAISNLNAKLSFFTDTMGYSTKECREILLRSPRIMTASATTGLMPRFQFLLKEANIPLADIQKIVKKNPRILMMSVDQNLQPKIIFYFIMTLYMDTAEVTRLLLSYPQILDYNLENHMQPITRFLLSLDFSAYEFSRMLLRFPRLMTYSLAKIKRVVGYLRFALGLEANDVRRVLYQAPQVLSLTTDNLQQKVDYLLEVSEPGANIDDPSSSKILRKLIVGMPPLLNLSVEKNLKPKAEYLEAVLGQAELSKAMDRLPTLLAYSLDNRIKPRLELILAAGVDGGSLTVGIPMKQDKFEGWLNRRAHKAAVESEKESMMLAEELSEVERTEEATDEKGRIIENEGRIVHWKRDD
eukprot:scaffold1669_cov129-Cylindrotheca_fusiformis.AAC.17